jgi:hypothetical protein
MSGALTALSTALAAGEVTAVLAAERPLADAVRHLPSRRAILPPEDRARLRSLLGEALRALQRCRQLGETAREVAAAGLIAHHGYGRSGALVSAPTRTTIDSRS